MLKLNIFIFFFSFFSFLFLNFFPSPVFFLIFGFSWLVLILVLIFKFKFEKEHLFLFFLNFLSFLIIYILAESKILRIIISFFIPFTFSFINFWFQTNLKRPVFLKEKPLRRMMMFLLVFSVYSFLVAIFAIAIYFIKIPFLFLSLLAGVCVALITRIIWQMYFKNEDEKINTWSIFIAVIIFELAIVFYFLPFGFFVSSLLITWLWYIMQLFIRFHISSKGIIWKKQSKFLLINFLLYIIILFIIRWI